MKESMTEIQDINLSRENHKIFFGEIDGEIIVKYLNEKPQDYSDIHLTRALLGIGVKPNTPDQYNTTLIFSSSSIYSFFCELEYLRAYSKYKELKIENMKVNISDVSDKFIDPELPDEEYNKLVIKELSDIEHYLKLEQLYSGSVRVKYFVEYAFIDKAFKDVGDYSSIFSFLMDLEEIRRDTDEEIIKRISLELTNLDDSNVRFDPVDMKEQDEDAKIIY